MASFRCPSCKALVYREGASSEWAHVDWMDAMRCFWRRLRRTGQEGGDGE